ncbi:MAG: GtrA family protein [Acidimicrobiia bacterium]|nr:GtrA family protein [Acidimicrobiia bacterium]MBV8303054.1 GtrA family protein [Acidimicrobiia bacterium]
MDLSPRGLISQARSPTGQKFMKYSAVSVISVAVNLVLLVFAFGVLGWSAAPANIFAVGVSAIPSYYLNRAWAWGKHGRSHLLKEVVPFWALAFLGLVVSTVAVHIVGNNIKQYSHFVQTLIVAATNIGAFGLLWVVKFVIFNELMFKHHPEVLEDEPALDGRAGIPG